MPARRDLPLLERFSAVLFDLDGVLTPTAQLHAAAWADTFDELLGRLADIDEHARRSFSDDDYLRYVDGRPRADGVRAFLASRDVVLPDGERGDEPDALTVEGVAERKQRALEDQLATADVPPFPDAVALVHDLRDRDVATAVVSASRNAAAVLEAAGIAHLFDVRVDGESAARLGLAGKPAPDTFLAAAERLAVDPGRAVVVEDAVAGVRAGRAGGFGMVVGVARHGDASRLDEAGADVIVDDLTALIGPTRVTSGPR